MATFTADAYISETPRRKYITSAEFRAKPFGVPLKQFSDFQIEDFIEIATVAVEQFTERIFAHQSHTETFVGDGSLTHLCHEYPLTSVTSLTRVALGGSGATDTYDVTNRLIRTTANDSVGRIELDGLDANIGSFSTSYKYTLVYTAGYHSIPAGVKHATALWASELMRPDYGGVSTSTPEIVPLTTEQIIELLTPIKRRRIG